MNVRRRRRERGQILPLSVLMLLALLGMTGLIVDGGNAYANQRILQGRTDSASEAGAVVIGQMITSGGAPSSEWDAKVWGAVNANALANDLEGWHAYYTDICGVLLTPSGAKASGPASAAEVGLGVMPPDLGANPDCPSGVVGPTQGVKVFSSHTFSTYISRVVGVNDMTASATATSISGFLQGPAAGSLVPLIVPVFVVACDGSGKVSWTGTPWPIGEEVTVPMCKNSAGNVGWLEWPGKTGGTANLIESIVNPNNPPFDIPSWQQVMLTGDKSAGGVVSAMNYYNGKIIQFLMFDATCQDEPGGTAVKDCTAGDATGTKGWYHTPRVAAFQLTGFYTKDSDCDPSGKGNTPSCLKGKFVYYITSGSVAAGYGGGGSASTGGVIGTQLIQ